MSYRVLPTSAAVALSFFPEVRDILHHPLVDLRESQPFVGGAGNGLSNEIGITVISPGVPPGGILLDRKQAGTLAESAMLRRRATFDAFDALFASRYARHHVSLDVFLRSWQRPRVRPCSRLWFEPALKVVRYPLLWLQPGLRPRRNRHRVHHVRFLCVLQCDREHLARCCPPVRKVCIAASPYRETAKTRRNDRRSRSAIENRSYQLRRCTLSLFTLGEPALRQLCNKRRKPKSRNRTSRDHFPFFFISRTLYISFSLSPAFLYVRDSSHGSLFHRPHDRQRYIARARCVSISTRRDCAERKREAAAKRLRGKAEYRGVSQSITRIELSRSWQRTDREYATLYVVLRIASERERNREGEAAREGQTAAREGADHVVKLTVYKPRRRSRGHVLIKNLAHCEERIFEFVAWRFLRGTLLRKLFAPGYGWPCRVAFRTRSRTRSRLVEQARLSMSSLLRNHRLSSYFSSMFPDRVLPTPSVFSN